MSTAASKPLPAPTRSDLSPSRPTIEPLLQPNHPTTSASGKACNLGLTLLVVTPCALATQARTQGELRSLTAGWMMSLLPAVLTDVPKRSLPAARFLEKCRGKQGAARGDLFGSVGSSLLKPPADGFNKHCGDEVWHKLIRECTVIDYTSTSVESAVQDVAHGSNDTIERLALDTAIDSDIMCLRHGSRIVEDVGR